MPPKVKIEKQDILNAAFKIAVESGLESITARKVAGSLSSSVVPVYSNFDNIEHLKQDVINKAKMTAKTFMEKRYTSIPFLNIGIGSLLFSIEHRELYKNILSDSVFFQNNMHLMAVGVMQRDEYLKGLSQNDLIIVFKRIRVCTIGLFLSAPKTNNIEQILQIIEELVTVTNDLINGERIRKGLDTVEILLSQEDIKNITKEMNDRKK